MSFKISATIDKKQFERFSKAVEAKYLPKIVAKSLNQAGTRVKNEIAKEMRSRLKSVPLKDIKSGIQLGKAKATDEIESQEVQLKNSSKGIGFEHFDQTQTKEGVRIVVVGKTELIKHAFIATMKSKSGYKGTFVRSVKQGGKGRRVWKTNGQGGKAQSSELPIVKKAFQLSQIYEMVLPEIKDKVATACGRELFEAMEKNLKKELEG